MWTLFSDPFSFLGSRAGKHENTEKLLYYFGLRILLPIQIQLLDIENPKHPKIDSPYCVVLNQKDAVLLSTGSTTHDSRSLFLFYIVKKCMQY
jgi:hypothetical protein